MASTSGVQNEARVSDLSQPNGNRREPIYNKYKKQIIENQQAIEAESDNLERKEREYSFQQRQNLTKREKICHGIILLLIVIIFSIWCLIKKRI